MFQPGDSALQLYKTLDKGGGEFLSYLDSDLTLADQNDEFSEMKSDRYVDRFLNHLALRISSACLALFSL